MTIVLWDILIVMVSCLIMAPIPAMGCAGTPPTMRLEGLTGTLWASVRWPRPRDGVIQGRVPARPSATV